MEWSGGFAGAVIFFGVSDVEKLAKKEEERQHVEEKPPEDPFWVWAARTHPQPNRAHHQRVAELSLNAQLKRHIIKSY